MHFSKNNRFNRGKKSKRRCSWANRFI